MNATQLIKSCNSRISQLLEGDTRKNQEGYLCVTLNHPHTTRFLNAPSEIQKVIYKVAWEHLLKKFKHIIIENEYVYEYTKKGQVHLHGYFKISMYPIIQSVILSDFAKEWLNRLPKKYRKFSETNIFTFKDGNSRYRSPSICISYRTDIELYREYMYKEEENKLMLINKLFSIENT